MNSATPFFLGTLPKAWKKQVPFLETSISELPNPPKNYLEPLEQASQLPTKKSRKGNNQKLLQRKPLEVFNKVSPQKLEVPILTKRLLSIFLASNLWRWNLRIITINLALLSILKIHWLSQNMISGVWLPRKQAVLVKRRPFYLQKNDKNGKAMWNAFSTKMRI